MLEKVLALLQTVPRQEQDSSCAIAAGICCQKAAGIRHRKCKDSPPQPRCKVLGTGKEDHRQGHRDITGKGKGYAASGSEESYVDLIQHTISCLLYTSPSPRDGLLSRMPSSA